LLADVPFLSSGPLGGSFRIGIPLEIGNGDIEAWHVETIEIPAGNVCAKVFQVSASATNDINIP
jgi:hypothetical protein